MNTNIYLTCIVLVLAMTVGCASKENPEAVKHTDPATVEKARQNNIEKVKNDPNLSPETKEKALQYMGGGGTAPKPLGAK